MEHRYVPRVLQVVLSLHPGGTERLVIDLVSRLRAECPMAVCCLDDAGAWAGELTRDGVGVTALARRPGFRLPLARAVARAARAHRATVIHAHHYSPFVYGALARFAGSRARVVFTEHGRLSDVGPSPKRRLANRALARLADATFAVSEDVRSHIVGEGFPDTAVGVIYNGIAITPLPDSGMRARIRARLSAGDDDCVVGTIARLDPVKDLGTLIRAIASIERGRRPLLVLVGDGPERGRLDELAQTLGISERVRFLGYQPDARDWLAGCDIYANSSISEGVSLTILEAMAAGLPVVATAVGGTPEVLDSSCGRLVPPRDAVALADSIGRLGSQPDVRAELGQAGRARVTRQFSIDRMVGEYLEIYRRLGRLARRRSDF